VLVGVVEAVLQRERVRLLKMESEYQTVLHVHGRDLLMDETDEARAINYSMGLMLERDNIRKITIAQAHEIEALRLQLRDADKRIAEYKASVEARVRQHAADGVASVDGVLDSVEHFVKNSTRWTDHSAPCTHFCGLTGSCRLCAVLYVCCALCTYSRDESRA
jgi:hypothetical protein